MNDEIFMVRARKCRRCNRLIFSADAIRVGMGCECAKKARAEEYANAPLPGQSDLFSQTDLFGDMTESEQNEEREETEC